MLANHVFWRLMLFYTHLLLLLHPSVLRLSIVTFNNDAKSLPKYILRKYDVSRIRPRLGVSPHLSCNSSKRLEHPNSRRTLAQSSGFTTRMTRFRLKTLKRLSKRNWNAQKGVACEYSCFSLLFAARDVAKGP